MSSLLITIAVLALVCPVVVSLFRRNNRELQSDFSKKMACLEDRIQLNEGQITIRDKGLNRYDFLKYNLGEALIVQPEIKI